MTAVMHLFASASATVTFVTGETTRRITAAKATLGKSRGEMPGELIDQVSEILEMYLVLR